MLVAASLPAGTSIVPIALCPRIAVAVPTVKLFRCCAVVRLTKPAITTATAEMNRFMCFLSSTLPQLQPHLEQYFIFENLQSDALYDLDKPAIVPQTSHLNFSTLRTTFHMLEESGHSKCSNIQMSPPCGRKRSNRTHCPSGDQTG